MFWRYLNTQGGQIDVLLARDPPPSLEELLDDDELLSELKGQSNTRLIDFLSRPEAIRGLMGWVTKGLESPEKRGRETEEDKKRATRFPALATEVLCSELWTIVETSLSPSHDLMRPFWEAVLSPVPTQDEVPLVPPGDTSSSAPSPSSAVMDVDLVDVLVDASTLSPIAAAVSSTDNAPSPELAETDSPAAAAAPKSITEQTLEDELAVDAGNGTELVYGLWARVNSVFLTKKTADMLSFIRSQPFVLERILRKIHSPAIVDLLFRIIQCEDAPSGQGVIDWLSSESLIPRLTSFLAPSHYPHHHETATDLLKGIITMSAPAPGPFNPNLGSPGGPDSGAPGGLGPMRNNKFARELVAEDTVERLVGYMLDEPLRTSDQAAANGDVASMAPSTSSLTSSIAVFIELIRKNNSDYSEPHLFHTLRQGLMQHSSSRPPLTECEAAETVTNGEDRESNDQKDMEDAMESLNQGMGIVHLGSMLTVLSARLGSFQELIERPRSDVQPVPTTAGAAAPLTLERFRIIELYAELLHCSNMAILNRPNGTGPSYDDDGRLVGGLSGLDDLSVALSASESDVDDRAADEVFQEAKELPVSTSSAASSDVGNMEGVVAESQTTSSVPDVLSSAPAPAEKEDIAVTATTAAPASGAKTPETSEPVISELVAAATPADTTASDVASVNQHAVLSTTAISSVSSNKAATSAGSSGGLSPGDTLKQTFIDRGLLLPLFDLLIEHPLNNFLHNVIYDIFQQILSGRLNPGLNRDLVVVLFNDASLINKVLHGQKLNDAMPVRLGFMGHLILIAEEILKFFERCPADLFAIIAPSYHASEWAAFVEGPYQVAKAKDNTIMGGGRPGPPLGSGMGMDGSGVDLESDSDDDDDNSPGMSAFSRNFGGGLSSEDGGSGNATEVFSRYLAQQMSSGASDRQFESSSSDDDDDDEGWINDSQSFNRPVSEDAFSSMRREGSHHARDDSFGASSSSAFDDDDDDAWGSFQSTPSRSTGDNADADPFGDDFAAPGGPQSTNSEALAALEWNDASFAQNFVDGDSGDEDDASTPTGSAPAGWGSFQPTSSDVSSTISAIPIPQSTSSIRLAARTTALSLSSPSSSPTERLQLPPGASSIFTPMSAISPPDASLLEAISVERPLGPGVDPKTTSEHHGLLEKKTAEGKTIVVPKDEIVLAVEAEAEKHP